MQDTTVGSIVRAVRRRSGLRQVDVARRAGLSQQTISTIERGRLEEVDLATLRRAGRALGIALSISAAWRGPDLDRLLDAAHAAMVEAAVARFHAAGWQAEVEWSFNHFGDRGAVDLLGWLPERRALAVVEVKTQLVDLQDLLGTLDRKVRVARELVPTERGWKPEVIGRAVILPDTSTARDAVDRHRVTFGVALPSRTMETRRWLRAPDHDLRAVWFLRGTDVAGAAGRSRAAGQRVRVSSRSTPSVMARDTSSAGGPAGPNAVAPVRPVDRSQRA
jgi:transcriptional regulator with XRE-family HTH domain